jgi:hypothetical protein
MNCEVLAAKYHARCPGNIAGISVLVSVSATDPHDPLGNPKILHRVLSCESLSVSFARPRKGTRNEALMEFLREAESAGVMLMVLLVAA